MTSSGEIGSGVNKPQSAKKSITVSGSQVFLHSHLSPIIWSSGKETKASLRPGSSFDSCESLRGRCSGRVPGMEPGVLFWEFVLL